ncbi:Ankyrin repeat domain-containing protein 53 [Anabarilius grahami]|uniref:Ankyrin repeat domain-containing protein 53 n=1 Tax=Anabarilius grahami TaxID=495550 RepID=A0A3N0XGQ7_ANAGA|nr:Ankyrin repeat domain-containing protein 53 [Anabarilius grahami]
METAAETSTNSTAMSVSRTDDSGSLVRPIRTLSPESDMFHAAACGAREWLSLTLKRARKPLHTDKHGLTVLHIAALHGYLDCMELLAEAGDFGDVNVSCPRGRRPLHMVLTAQSRQNKHACLIYLLEHGAQTNVATDEGMTPLHLAAAEGLMDCTETLVRNGADTHARDKRDHTPLDLARIWGHRVIASTFELPQEPVRFILMLRSTFELPQEPVRFILMLRSTFELPQEAMRSILVLRSTFELPQEPMMFILVLRSTFELPHEVMRFILVLRSTFELPQEPVRFILVLRSTFELPQETMRLILVLRSTFELPQEAMRFILVLRSTFELPQEPMMFILMLRSTFELPQEAMRFLKDAMWRKDKQQEMVNTKQQHNLRQFQCFSVLDLPRLGQSLKTEDSPWTEVAMHLAEELKPGHY